MADLNNLNNKYINIAGLQAFWTKAKGSIVNGTLVAGKAAADGNGNNIAATYLKTEDYNKKEAVLNSAISAAETKGQQGIDDAATARGAAQAAQGAADTAKASADLKIATITFENTVDTTTPAVTVKYSSVGDDKSATIDLKDYATVTAMNKAIGDMTHLSVQVGDKLPETGKAGDIFLKGIASSGQQQYEEYIYDSVNSRWEALGLREIDLSAYAKTTAVTEAVSAAEGRVKAIIGDGYDSGSTVAKAITTANDKIAALESKLGTSDTASASLTERVTNLESADTTIKANIDTNKQGIATNLASIGTINEKLATIQGEEGTTGSIKAGIKTAKDYTDTKNSAMNTRVEALETTVTANTTGLVAKVAKLEETVGSSASGLVQKVNTNAADIATIKGDGVGSFAAADTATLTAAKNYTDEQKKAIEDHLTATYVAASTVECEAIVGA